MTAAEMAEVTPHRPSHMRSEDAYAMVTDRYGAGKGEITDECAVTIASWWQSPGSIGSDFAALASRGTVAVSALLDDIAATYREATDARDRQALDMLATWAMNHYTRHESCPRCES